MKRFVVSVLILFAPMMMAHEGHVMEPPAALHHVFTPHVLLVSVLFTVLLILSMVVTKRSR